MVCGEDGLVCSRPIDRTDLHRGSGGPDGVGLSAWRNTGSPMGGQATASTGGQAGQGPGGRGCGRKRRPSGHRRERATTAGGETHPDRGLTSHRSSRRRRRQGHGRHGPHGRAAPGPERPGRSAHGWVPDRLDHSGTERPKPALSDLPRIGLSGMRGNSHVPFLGEEAMVTPPPYPTVRSFLASASGSG